MSQCICIYTNVKCVKIILCIHVIKEVTELAHCYPQYYLLLTCPVVEVLEDFSVKLPKNPFCLQKKQVTFPVWLLSRVGGGHGKFGNNNSFSLGFSTRDPPPTLFQWTTGISGKQWGKNIKSDTIQIFTQKMSGEDLETNIYLKIFNLKIFIYDYCIHIL